MDSSHTADMQVSLNLAGGGLADGPDHPGDIITMSSEFTMVEGEFNANGIEVIDGMSMHALSTHLCIGWNYLCFRSSGCAFSLWRTRLIFHIIERANVIIPSSSLLL